MSSPFLYFPGARLSTPELAAACLDGHLVAVGDAFMPADGVETAALRAGSLAPLLGSALAAVHLTAAWVHGALPDPPARHSVQRAVPRRLPHVLNRRLLYRDAALPTADLLEVGGVLVTTPARTIADLARLPDREGRALARIWARDDPVAAAEGQDWLAARGSIPYGRVARMLLTPELPIHDDVTR